MRDLVPIPFVCGENVLCGAMLCGWECHGIIFLSIITTAVHVFVWLGGGGGGVWEGGQSHSHAPNETKKLYFGLVFFIDCGWVSPR